MVLLLKMILLDKMVQMLKWSTRFIWGDLLVKMV